MTRDIEQIQEAHDLLETAIHLEDSISFEGVGMDRDTLLGLICVLCWVLQHDDGFFANLLKELEQAIKEAGFETPAA